MGSTKSNPSTTFPDEQKVNERSKKALVHRVKLGEEVQAMQAQVCPCKRLDSEPLVTFVFKYRPLEILKAHGIVPVVAGVKRGAGSSLDEPRVKREGPGVDSVDAEIKALEKRMKILKARHAQRSRIAKRVKTEPLDQSAFMPGEVIDLT